MKRLHRGRRPGLSVIAAALSLLVLPALASAQDARCQYSAPRSLKLDLAGAHSVLFNVGSSNLRLKATSGSTGTLDGRACASSKELLDDMQLQQERQGDKLVVTLMPAKHLHLSRSMGTTYWYMDLDGSVPDDVLVQLDVGSGDASLRGGQAASADIGSGDVDLQDVAGLVTAKVGSGDLKLHGAGALKVLSVGSGDVVAAGIKGKTEVGSIGSGDVTLDQVGAGVDIGSIGSGDLRLGDITGDVTVGSIGSGDLDARDIRGNLSVRRKGSGDIDHRGVTGTVDIAKH
ncbi:hypothetical protein [Pseudoxanthomonas sp. JBR18]|uniref:hypothetical protein n=1 Tax=Pseudoxanthomonas sp. JBR18 TaxID=2969308 RepID=UPI0023057AB1|nr:hypothetical protein [Pseudoxanthomonas sp. JBR18]WCE03991.1 hypothetical protein PJ250_18250 [Pseudoxanthomonas sp. JBR18]